MGTEYGTRDYTAVWYIYEYGDTKWEHELGTRVWDTKWEHEYMGTWYMRHEYMVYDRGGTSFEARVI